MEKLRKQDIKYTWELISEFVCWEFCRNANFKGDFSDVQNQTDLLQFFKDMVIKMTVKQYENEITSHEIAAKFIEELSVMAISQNPKERVRCVRQLSGPLKTACPVLIPAITELLAVIFSKLLSWPESSNETLMEHEEIRSAIAVFSFEVYKHLPVPSLIKATTSWKKNNGVSEPVVTKEAVLSRLKKEKLTRNEIMKIKGYIEEDSLLKMYFDEVSYKGPGLEDFPEDVTETDNSRPASSKKSPQKKTASRNSKKSSTKKPVSLDDYFIPDTHEIDETLEEDIGTRQKSSRIVNRLTSDSDDEPEIIVEKLNEQSVRDLYVRLDRVDYQSAAGKRAYMGNDFCEMPVPVDKIKEEKSTPPKKGETSSKPKRKKKNMFI